MAPHPEPFFLSLGEGTLGQRFALHHAPHTGRALGLVVYVHPFAEEMNKSRRMAALHARALAAAGYAVLQIDLLGCGDSGGDFGDATWTQWVDDVVHACCWLRQRHMLPPHQAAPPLWLWGLRVGCLLAAEAAVKLDCTCDFLFWQPTTAGATALQQFLRLKLAGDLLRGNAKGEMAALRQQLAGGQAAEIAGYLLSPALAAGLERAKLLPPPRPGRIEWLEVATSAEGSLSPASTHATESWRQAGWQVRTHVVVGPAFWQTIEIEDAPALLTATLSALQGEEGATAQCQFAARPGRDADLPRIIA